MPFLSSKLSFLIFLSVLFVFAGAIFFLLFGIALVSAYDAQAHGPETSSLEKRVGEYLVDIGHSPQVISAGSSITFDFNLLNAKTEEQLSFTDIWVRIERERQTIFASGLHKPQFGALTMIYTFPRGGGYDLKIRFQKENEALAEATFPFSVAASAASSESPQSRVRQFIFFLLGVVGGAVGGVVIGFFLKFHRK